MVYPLLTSSDEPQSGFEGPTADTRTTPPAKEFPVARDDENDVIQSSSATLRWFTRGLIDDETGDALSAKGPA